VEPEKRSLIDRVMRGQRPLVVPGFTPPPRAVTENIWSIDRRIAMRGGISLPTRSTVVRLPSGELFVHSPVHLDEETQVALESLGQVQYLVAPNSFHYLYAGGHLGRFPSAQLFLAPGLPERCPELPPATLLGRDAPTAWAGVLGQAVFGPVQGVSEVAFHHAPSETLILTDLCFHIRSAESVLEQIFWRINGAWNRFGPSFIVRMALLRDQTVVRTFVKRVLTWSFDRIIVAHGDVLESGGRAAFEKAFARYLK
jgi:hypothetical protein